MNKDFVDVERLEIVSTLLDRTVKLDIYLPAGLLSYENLPLLLVNDGQDLVKMQFENIIAPLFKKQQIQPIICAALHCGDDRKNEYGTAKFLDYKGRGTKAKNYNKFIFEEAIPYIRKKLQIINFSEKNFAGFSLGGLSALDIVWNHAPEFFRVGVFSGSLWWRSKSQEEADFDEDKHRIMHDQIRNGNFAPWLQFFFEVGTKDETADRNNNGVIDAIDDTVSLVEELAKKGYDKNSSIHYLELKDGKHDVPTWASAFPQFLLWGWGINNEVMD
jgi:enterochelin esterase-like enzyme